MSLPPRGSARDQVLRAVIRREREEKYALVRHFSQLLSAAFKLNPQAVGTLLEDYYGELTQAKYDPPIIGAALRAATTQMKKSKGDAQLLKRVDSYTVEDDELPPPKAPRRRR